MEKYKAHKNYEIVQVFNEEGFSAKNIHSRPKVK